MAVASPERAIPALVVGRASRDVAEEEASGRQRPGRNKVVWGHDSELLPQVNIRQANGIGRVHVAKPQMKETYCGRPVNEEEWLTTPKEANCTACARAGAPIEPEQPRRRY